MLSLLYYLACILMSFILPFFIVFSLLLYREFRTIANQVLILCIHLFYSYREVWRWRIGIMSLTHKAISSMLLGMNGFDPSFTPILQVISIRKLIRKIGVGVSGEGDERWKVSPLYFCP